MTRETEVQVGGRCIGSYIASARGFIAYDGKRAQIGTYATVERAISAVAGQAGGGSGGDARHLPGTLSGH